MFEQNILLSHYSHYKIGGPAKYFYQANSFCHLMEAVEKCKKEDLPIFILGHGTNLLIDDSGFSGLVLKPEIQFLFNQDEIVQAGAGILVSDLLNFVADKGLAGLEWAGGLPGTLGGAIRGNAGAFGGEIKDCLAEVISLDISAEKPKIVKRNNQECLFGYRHSIFKEKDNKEIILAATFNLKKDDPQKINQAIEEKINYRFQRHPVDYPNVGSIFKNVNWDLIPSKHHETFKEKIKQDPFPILPAAVLIDRCGLRGVSYGGAIISPKHPNFIVNSMQATAKDVKKLIGFIKDSVKEKFNINLEEEVQYV